MSIKLIPLEKSKTMGVEEDQTYYHRRNCLFVKYTDPKFPTIQMNEQGDWIDLKAFEDYELKAGEFAIINLGVAMRLPNEFEALLAPRSSTFKKYGIIQTNSIGVIDNSYSGNNDIWGLPVYAMRDTKINKGDRICQFRLIERMNSLFDTHLSPVRDLYIIEVEKLDSPDRGGFGSTDK